MPVYFVHCNVCGALPSSRLIFFVASCGHVACADCVRQQRMQTCYVCRKPTKLQKLNDRLDERIKKFFRDPTEMLTDIRRQVQVQVERKAQQNRQLEQENRSLLAQIRQLDDRLEELRNERPFSRQMPVAPSPGSSLSGSGLGSVGCWSRHSESGGDSRQRSLSSDEHSSLDLRFAPKKSRHHQNAANNNDEPIMVFGMDDSVSSSGQQQRPGSSMG